MTISNVRLAVRGLVKTPGFTVTVVLTLALGIGANTAIFSLVNDVLFRELPVRDPGELVLFRNVEGRDGRLSRAGENNGSLDPATGRPASTSTPKSGDDRSAWGVSAPRAGPLPITPLRRPAGPGP